MKSNLNFNQYKALVRNKISSTLKGGENTKQPFIIHKLEMLLTKHLLESKTGAMRESIIDFKCMLEESLPTVPVSYESYSKINLHKIEPLYSLLQEAYAHYEKTKAPYYIKAINHNRTFLIINCGIIAKFELFKRINLSYGKFHYKNLILILGKNKYKYVNFYTALQDIKTKYNNRGLSSPGMPALNTFESNGICNYRTSPASEILKYPSCDDWNKIQSPIKNNMYDYISSWLISNRPNILTSIPCQLGTIVSGPKGCGKTSLIVALAKSLQLNVKFIDYSKPMRDQLENIACGTVVIFDDIDCAFGMRAQQTASLKTKADLAKNNVMTSRKELIEFNDLLGYIEGKVKHVGVIFVLVTNYIDTLDTALTRRFGRHYAMEYFSKKDTEQYCKKHNVPFSFIDQLVTYPERPSKVKDLCEEYMNRKKAFLYKKYAQFLLEKNKKEV